MAEFMIIILSVFLLVFMGIVLTIVSILSKSYRVRVRDAHLHKGYIIDYWVLPKKEKDTGVIWWKSVFWQKQIKLPEPPEKCIDVGLKGRKYVEVKRLSEDEFVFIKDKGIDAEVVLEDGKKISESFQAFSVVQRQVVVDQFVKAEAERNQSWLKENGMNLAFGGFMTIIIVMGLVYWGDIAQANIQQQDATTGILHEINKVVKDMSGISTVSGATGGGVVTDSDKPPAPPPD